jgi:hypothetical protein
MFQVVEYDAGSAREPTVRGEFANLRDAKRAAIAYSTQTYGRHYTGKRVPGGMLAAYSDWAVGADGVADNVVFAVREDADADADVERTST